MNTLTKQMTTMSKLFLTTTLVILSGISNVNAIVETPNPLELSDLPTFLKGSAPPAVAISIDTTPGTRNAYMFSFEGIETDNGSIPSAKNFLAAPLVNKVYYQPDYEYQIPLEHDGTEFNAGAQTTYKEAYVNGFEPNRGVVNLSCEYRVVRKFNETGGSYQDFSGDEASCERSNNPKKPNPDPVGGFYMKFKLQDGQTLVAPDSYIDDDNYEKVEIFDDPATPFNDFENFAIWYSYYKSRNLLMKSSATIAFHDLANAGSGIKLAWQSFKQNESFETLMYPLIEDHPVAGNHKKAFWDWMFGIKPTGSGALVEAVNNAGKLFETPQTYFDKGTGEQLSCQQNFHVILANARANGPGKGTKLDFTHDNVASIPAIKLAFDKTEGKIFTDDGDDGSVEDYAFHYWANDLMPLLDNGVPQYLNEEGSAKLGLYDASGNLIGIDTAGLDYWDVTDPNNSDAQKIFWNNYNDPANWQHMVNFVISLGMPSYKDILDPVTYNELRTEEKGWYKKTPKNNGTFTYEKVFADKLQHAAVNSRGDYVLAYTPKELIDAFQLLIKRLLTRKSGSGAASTVSANIVSNDTKSFKTAFDIRDWSGSVVAQGINPDGTLGAAIWDAACSLTGGKCGALGGVNVTKTRDHTDRKIWAYDKVSGETRAFKATSLHDNQKDAFRLNSKLILDDKATLDDVVEYLRGDRSKELKNGGVFRNRRVLLGDVIHSSAKVVRGPSEAYVDNGKSNSLAPGYEKFKEDNFDRKNIVLVGANDGMLHAFDIDTGDEIWAYIPSQSLNNMHLLAEPDYEHQNFVDSSPIIRDVYINGAWKTVAVGGLRLGGQGYYALDITDPEVPPTVLWEFTDDSTGDKGDADMGFSYGEAFVTRVRNKDSHNNGDWVALLPNGYNSIINDGNVGSGESVLYMVNMATGIKMKEYSTGEGSPARTNGMAGAVVSDVPFDLNGDTAFVGDLKGDIYRIDLTDSSFPDEVKMIKAVSDYKNPITIPLRLTQRVVFSQDHTDVLVHFGSGKFIEDKDKTEIPTVKQYVGAVFDQGKNGSYPIDLKDDRMVLQTASHDPNDFTKPRIITKKPVTKGTHLGWVMILPGEGERVIAKMSTRASAYFLIYSTFLPKGGSACSTGGSSFVSVVDSRYGGQPEEGPVLKDNSTIANADGVYVDNQVFGVTPIGFAGGGGEILIIGTDAGPTSGGEESSIVIPDFTWRRRSWHRIIPDGG